MGASILEASVHDREPEHTGNRSRRDAPHNVFRCAGEDAWCAIAVETDTEWLALAATIGRQDLAARADLRGAAGRLAAMEELEAAVTAWTQTYGAVEAAGILQNASVPAARVSSARDLVEEDPQLAARGYWQTLDHPEMGPSLFTAPPFTIDGERVELRRPPLFGEHTQEVLTGLLGMSDAEIAELAERKILA